MNVKWRTKNLIIEGYADEHRIADMRIFDMQRREIGRGQFNAFHPQLCPLDRVALEIEERLNLAHSMMLVDAVAMPTPQLNITDRTLQDMLIEFATRLKLAK